MANNHGLVNSTRMTAWDVDAYVGSAIAEVDMDNGVIVTANSLNLDAEGNVIGYERKVVPAAADAMECWIVRTPEVGIGLEEQYLSDPRYFYNRAGRPMTILYLNPKVDHVEVDANCFVEGQSPADVTGAKFVGIGAEGKMVALAAAPAAGMYFSIAGKHSMDVGFDLVPTWVLKVERN